MSFPRPRRSAAPAPASVTTTAAPDFLMPTTPPRHEARMVPATRSALPRPVSPATVAAPFTGINRPRPTFMERDPVKRRQLEAERDARWAAEAALRPPMRTPAADPAGERCTGGLGQVPSYPPAVIVRAPAPPQTRSEFRPPLHADHIPF
jgi:hypothetical protein